MPESEAAYATDYFAMGGYAEFVWPAYGLAAVAIIGMVLWSVLRTRALERQADQLRRDRGRGA